MNQRPFIIAANWKLNKSPLEAQNYLKSFSSRAHELKLMSQRAEPGASLKEIVFFIPAISLWLSGEALRGTGIYWGAQNVYFENTGAFTGENSPAVVKEIGATHALVGHSERRAVFNEGNDVIAQKVRAIQMAGLQPMICVGESSIERESGRTNQVIVDQARAALKFANLGLDFSLAYEPVWAIGTGKVATPDQANQAHSVLRQVLRELNGESFATRIPILYGGSVKPENANEIASQSEVDGFLVGGASLEVSSFLSLCQTNKN